MHRSFKFVDISSVLVTLFLAVAVVNVSAFNSQQFLRQYCREDKNAKLFCSNFHLNRNNVSDIQNVAFDLSYSKLLEFSNCTIGILNENFFNKFPQATEMIINKCTFSMNSSTRATLERELPLRTLKFRKCFIANNDNTNALRALTHLENFINSSPECMGTKILDRKFFEYNRSLRLVKFERAKLEGIEEDALANLHHLEEALFSHNCLEKLNSTVFRYNRKLRRLSLQRNKLLLLPNTAIFPESLESLHLNHNLLKAVTANHFRRLTRLEFLNLGYNRIKVLSENAFDDLRNLRHLNLYFNQITNIARAHYKGVPHLETLHMQENKITNFDNNLLDDLTLLTNFDI